MKVSPWRAHRHGNVYDSLKRVTDIYLRNSAHTDLSRHSYQYNAVNWRTKHTRLHGDYDDYTYDHIGQLKTATGRESGGATRLHEQFSYGYDAAGNLNSRTNNALAQTFNVNSRNQLTSVSRSGTLTVAGSTSSAATNVTVNGQSATRYADHAFAKDGFTVTNGNNAFTAVAQNSLGQADTNAITFHLPASVSYTHDANGNLTGDGLWTYFYDQENRLSFLRGARFRPGSRSGAPGRLCSEWIF